MSDAIHDGAVGELAYADFFGGGLVPCKVIGIETAGCGRWVSGGKIVVRLTASRGAWKRGEIHTCNASSVVPRKMARIDRDGFTVIDVRYSWGVGR
jgi:hypothetical protein